MNKTDNRIALARAVIKEAQAGGFERGEMPEWDADILKLADQWYKEAKKEYERGGKHPTVIAIVSLVDEQFEHGNTVVADTRGEEPDHALTAVEKTYPRRSSGGLSESDERETENYPVLGEMDETSIIAFKNKLPAPQEFDGEPTQMPRDLTQVGDKQIRRLSSEYQAYLNRARWLQAIALSDLANVQHLYDHEYRRAFKESREEIIDRDERPTKDIVDALAQEDKKVLDMADNIRKHQNEVTAYTALVKIFEGNVDRLSREATLRQYEWERSK